MISCEMSHILLNQRTSPHLAGHQPIPGGSRRPTLVDATNQERQTMSRGVTHRT